MRPKRVRDPYAPPRAKSPEQALSSLMSLCAKSEKSSGDALRLMSRWGVEPEAQEQVLKQLLKDRFIDDERYAAAFVREKINLNGWGEYKIKSQLLQKGISKEIIEETLEGTNTERMSGRLAQMLERKSGSIKYKSRYELRDKLIRYGASLGYAFSQVSDAAQQIISNIKEEEEEWDDF